ncbi:MAG TPA: acetyl-CoA C-acyltransferase [Novosphingobium sp.]|nr:acetyl-CoA C-acyltransferase [Novosphingobium sp.]
MRQAVIVSTARTPIAKAFRGAYNMTKAPTLGGHVVREAVRRAGIEGGSIDDVIMGASIQAGSTGLNIGRMCALAAGLPDTVPGMSIDRQCASGLMSIATAAKQIMVDGQNTVVAGGVESVSLVQNRAIEWAISEKDDTVLAASPAAYMPMLETAEIVAHRYGISREAQDELAASSQRRAAAAQAEGRFAQELAPLSTTRRNVDRATGAVTEEAVLLTADEGVRGGTTLESLAALAPVIAGGSVTAGNSSQLSDAASACVLMEESHALKQGLTPLAVYRGMAVAGCAPDEMGIGPVFAIPRLLALHGLRVSDIDLWELNEAFAVQVIHCRDVLGIPDELLNVDGGGISMGHPYGMTGSRLVGHSLIEGRRRNAKNVVISMCIGGGMGAAALFQLR